MNLELSYLALFAVCFLSSTILPLGSEAFVLGFVKLNFNAYLILTVASIANSLGSISTYFIALLGKEKILKKYFLKQAKKADKLSPYIKKFGAFFAFFSFLPFVGDIFALALGFARYSLVKSIVFISLGKTFRYALLIFLSIKI